MPATSRYAGESDEAFKARMMGQNPAAFGLQVAPGLPSAVPPQGMMGGMAQMGMGSPDPMAQGPQRAPNMASLAGSANPLDAGPPPPTVDPNALPEDVFSALLATPEYQAELEGLLEQRAQAEALRDAALPEMRGGGGRVQTAANPLEFLATGIKQYRGAKAAKKLEGEVGEKRGKIAKNEGTYAGHAAKVGGIKLSNPFKRKEKKDDEDKD